VRVIALAALQLLVLVFWRQVIGYLPWFAPRQWLFTWSSTAFVVWDSFGGGVKREGIRIEMMEVQGIRTRLKDVEPIDLGWILEL
jgi:hypothetical protein